MPPTAPRKVPDPVVLPFVVSARGARVLKPRITRWGPCAGCTPDRTIYVGDGSSDLYVMHHVNSHDGCTVAVSETKSIARIARRSVLSENALSVLIPILEETFGWNPGRIRDLFTSCGVAIQEWDKVRTDWLTFQRTPTPFVLNGTRADGSTLLVAESSN